jgi:hypothetical protein
MDASLVEPRGGDTELPQPGPHRGEVVRAAGAAVAEQDARRRISVRVIGPSLPVLRAAGLD